MRKLTLLAYEQPFAAATLAAVVMHLVLIVGVSFEWHSQRTKAPMLEITLATRQDLAPPEQADFLAQADQIGSGDSDTSQTLFTPYEAPFQANQVQPQQQSFEHQQRINEQAAIRVADSPWWMDAEREKAPDEEGAEHISEFAENGDIASLEAHLDHLQQRYAKMPRVKRLTSVSTQRAEDAAYVLQWQRQIESTGNRFYPQRAKQLGIEGDVRLMVALLPDGTVKEVRLLQSSGSALLDQAARGIVELAAPFAPLPLEIAKDTDILEIIRTWQFRRDRLSSKIN
ncbi:MAG TPA: energy transducer TonB [Pseudomonadales bacterium]|nr:energy transducer TonB [Pseudomonadales bacterium]